MRSTLPMRPLTALIVLASLSLAGCPGEAPPTTEPVMEPAAGTAPPPPLTEAPARPDPAKATRGIDISVHSGAVDWARVAQQDFGFAFVKATEGVDLADPAFPDHWPAVKDAGLIRGAYHFYVTEDDPHEQARFFIENVTLEPGDLAPVVDVELIGHDTPPGLAERLGIFLELLEAHYGVKPIIYTSPNFWDAHLTDTFGDYPLWIAEYGVDEPRTPEGWEAWHLWQWRENVPVDGVEKEADLSRTHPLEPGLADLVVP